MRRVLLLLAALVGVTALLTGCSGSSSSVSTVGAQEFVTSAAEPGTVVVDVRTPAEFAAGHVDGAVNINVESPDFATQIAALPKDTTYAVYCRTGRRSALATDQMAEAGFTSVVNLQGGLADLQAAGAPVVTG
ncbi:MAG TPA: rhodanese-like domain-containing protein [Candidatus Nanopelagicales bacterium]